MTDKQINKRLAALKGKDPMSEAWQDLLCDVQEELEATQEKIADLDARWELTEKQEEAKESLEEREGDLQRVFDALERGTLPEAI